MKNYLIDTIATILFFTFFAALSELFVAGMQPGQVLLARLIMIPVMVLTARPYGLWRDWVFAKAQPRQWLTSTATDIAAFVVFQVPVYVATLMASRATATEIVTAVSAAIVSMIFLSRPFGLYLEAWRRWADSTIR